MNIDCEAAYKEGVEKDIVAIDLNRQTAMAYKNYNGKDACLTVYIGDIPGNKYYPSHYTSTKIIAKLSNDLEAKF